MPNLRNKDRRKFAEIFKGMRGNFEFMCKKVFKFILKQILEDVHEKLH